MYQTLHSHHNHYIPRAASIRGLLDHPFAHLQTSIYTCIPRLFYPFPHLWRSADYPHLRLSADNPYAILSLKIISSDSHSTSFAESIEWASFHCTYDRRWVSEHALLPARASITFYLSWASMRYFLPLPARASMYFYLSWANKRYFLPERASVCFSQLDSHSFLSGQECNVHRNNNLPLEIFIFRTITAQRWPSKMSWHKIKVMVWLWKLLSVMIYRWWMLQRRSNAVVITVANIWWLILLWS